MLHFLSTDIIYTDRMYSFDTSLDIAAQNHENGTAAFHYTIAVCETSSSMYTKIVFVMQKHEMLVTGAAISCNAAFALDPLSHLFAVDDLFGELLNLLLCLSAELLRLVDDGVGALLGLLCSLTKLALNGGKTVLCLELQSLLAAAHAVEELVCLLRFSEAEAPLLKCALDLYVLPVLDVAVTLGSLCAEVDQVASEEEVVPGLNGHGVAHEGGAVTDKSCGHGTGDTVVESFVSFVIL